MGGGKVRKPTKEQKLEIVRRYLAGETMYALGRETGYPAREIREWILSYRKKGEKGLEPRKKLPGFIFPVLMAVFAAAIALSAYKIAENRQEQQIGTAAYTAMKQTLVKADLPAGTEYETAVTEETPVIDVERPSVEVDFDALQAINRQGIAWLCSNDGRIDYPVVQGTDNDYYLNHLPDGTVNKNGSIFMDFRNSADFSDQNTFIYGHNMLDGTMFASLSRYSEAGYYEKHPSLLLITPERSYSLQVFAGCVVPGNSDVYQLTYGDDADFSAYLEKISVLSEFSTPVEVGQKDRIVTLSTCAYNYEDARYVLFCKLMPMQ